MGEHRGAQGAEEALDVSLSGGLIGAGVDERDAEFRAHERERLGAVVRTVVDEPSHGEPAACDGLLAHGQERGGVVRVGEGGEGDDAGGIVDERDEEGFSAPAPVAHLRPVHHVAHRKRAGVAQGESSPVGCTGRGPAGIHPRGPTPVLSEGAPRLRRHPSRRQAVRMWTRPAQRAPSCGACGQGLDKGLRTCPPLVHTRRSRAHILTASATTTHHKGDGVGPERFSDCFVIPGNSSTKQTGELPWGFHET